jgi:hypothetical protein
MSDLINSILNKDFTTAKALVNEKLENIVEKKKLEVKKMIAAKKVVEQDEDFMIKHQHDDRRERLKRGITEKVEQIDEARFKIVKARIRGGKIQRRKKVSTQPGMTFRGGKLIRMSPAERRRRKMGQRKGKLKRRGKMAMIKRRQKMSVMKRKRLGL